MDTMDGAAGPLECCHLGLVSDGLEVLSSSESTVATKRIDGARGLGGAGGIIHILYCGIKWETQSDFFFKWKWRRLDFI